MNQDKIGSFIAQRRQQLGLTQKELAEKLSVSNRAVSKWETGRGLPDIDNMQRLCEIYDVRINDLLSGEQLSDTSYSEKAEENMLHLIREQDKERRARFLLRGLVGICIIFSFTMYSLGVMTGNFGVLANYIDLPSILLDIGGMLLMLVLSGLLKDFGYGIRFGLSKKKIPDGTSIEDMYIAVVYAGKYILWIGILGAMISLLYVLHNITAPVQLGPCLAVAFLTVFYSIVMRLLLLPVEIGLRKKL